MKKKNVSESAKVDRRSFLSGSVAAGAAAAAAPWIIPASAFGANDRMVMGLIGAGGRGRNLTAEFIKQGVACAAVCDVYQPNLDEGVRMASADGKTVRAHTRYEELLEQGKDLDVIYISTPEHQHAHQLVDTVNAGFDCYCEKPMSHSIEEGNWIVKKVNKTNRVVQIGMQRRSSPMIHRGKEIIDSGVLGDVHFVRVKWNWWYHAKPLSNEPLAGAPLGRGKRPEWWKEFARPSGGEKYEPKKFRNWRWFWSFSGGNITDQGTHLMDVVQWYMGTATDPVLPNYAECFGRVYKMQGAETPDVFTSIYDYDKFTVSWSLDYATKYQDGWSIEFQGENASMVVDQVGVRVWPHGGEKGNWEPSELSTLHSKMKPITVKGQLGSEEHVANFLECVKSRKKPNAPVEIGHKAVMGPHLANVAYKSGERAYLNKSATKTTTCDWWAQTFWD